jgi:hypothetical protein
VARRYLVKVKPAKGEVGHQLKWAYTWLNMAQTEIIFAVQESPEGGYEARALGFSIFTQADSLEELKTMVRDAVSCHFDAASKPAVIRLHMVKDGVIPA